MTFATVVEKGTATDESKDACDVETATNLVTSIAKLLSSLLLPLPLALRVVGVLTTSENSLRNSLVRAWLPLRSASRGLPCATERIQLRLWEGEWSRLLLLLSSDHGDMPSGRAVSARSLVSCRTYVQRCGGPQASVGVLPCFLIILFCAGHSCHRPDNANRQKGKIAAWL